MTEVQMHMWIAECNVVRFLLKNDDPQLTKGRVLWWQALDDTIGAIVGMTIRFRTQ